MSALPVLNVASLVLEARKDAALHEALVQVPSQVAERRQIDTQVTETAAYILQEAPKTKNSIWY